MIKSLILSILCFQLAFHVTTTSERIWPEGEWIQKPLMDAGLNTKIFGQLLRYLFFSKQDFQTNSFVVIKDGYLIYERYANGFRKGQPQRAWSVTKSVTNALIGIGIHKGYLNLEQSVGKFVKDFQGVQRSALTINHLMRMSSGLSWKEGYEYDPFSSDVIAMLYTTHFQNMASRPGSKEFEFQPGTKFRYSSGETNLLIHAFRQALPVSIYDDFPWKELFDPLGITTATWERDAAGTFVGSSYLFISPEDLGRIGLLFLRNGVWKDRRLLPEDWVKYSTEPAPAFAKTTLKGKANCQSYGAQWWLNKPTPEKNCTRPYPDGPENVYLASGHHGQNLIIMPDQNIILVRNGADRKARIDINLVLKYIMESLQ